MEEDDDGWLFLMTASKIFGMKVSDLLASSPGVQDDVRKDDSLSPPPFTLSADLPDAEEDKDDEEWKRADDIFASHEKGFGRTTAGHSYITMPITTMKDYHVSFACAKVFDNRLGYYSLCTVRGTGAPLWYQVNNGCGVQPTTFVPDTCSFHLVDLRNGLLCALLYARTCMSSHHTPVLLVTIFSVTMAPGIIEEDIDPEQKIKETNFVTFNVLQKHLFSTKDYEKDITLTISPFLFKPNEMMDK